MVLTTGAGPSYSIQAYYTPGVGYFSGGQMHFYQENAQGSGKSDFRFAGAHGYIKDDETGMELCGARHYLPVLGRFLNQDPIGLQGGLNLYEYCDNSPLQKLDPKGTQAVDTVDAYIQKLWRIFGEDWQGMKEAVSEARTELEERLEGTTSRLARKTLQGKLDKYVQLEIKLDDMIAGKWHSATEELFKDFNKLDKPMQEAAKKAFRLLKQDPGNRGLNFEKLKGFANKYSVRINDQYRAIGIKTKWSWEWQRIIPHTYNIIK
ncbi:MAG: hypothetical protein JST12_18205 [Armatimonadetes bacterium]|nr:hypothetical protein [Armatimonadota bacterium]